MASLHVAIYDAMIATWHAKYLHRRPRLSELHPSLSTAIPNPNSPLYPSEHAVAAGAASAVLGYFFPQQAAFFNAKAEEAAESRLAGVQYPSDVKDGLELGRAAAALVIARAGRWFERRFHRDDSAGRLQLERHEPGLPTGGKLEDLVSLQA